MYVGDRARRHAALGDERRLLIVDQLAAGDRAVAELTDLVGLRGNLLAHHLDVLEGAGLIERRTSEGDHRRRYVSLRWEGLPPPVAAPTLAGEVAFVCTHNSARSQFAAALWKQRTGAPASSAGTEPVSHVHPTAVQVATEFGVDISRARPSSYASLPGGLDALISVCDRAHEAGLPEAGQHLHWSVPDPVRAGTLDAFRAAFDDIARRMQHFTAGGAS